MTECNVSLNIYTKGRKLKFSENDLTKDTPYLAIPEFFGEIHCGISRERGINAYCVYETQSIAEELWYVFIV